MNAIISITFWPQPALSCVGRQTTKALRSTGEDVLLKHGNSTLIPAAIADYDIIPQSGKTRILDAFIDNMDRSITSKVTRFLHLTLK